jgi:D-alanyl-lipoteichoic acid acyltransferase DltB (MBOAT superfamily)
MEGDMLFNSSQFVFFFMIIFILYFAIPIKFRNIVLLIGSYYFYMCWKPEIVIVLIAYTLVNYYAGIKIDKTNDNSIKKRYLYGSMSFSVGMLLLFKYFNFFNDSLRSAFKYFNIFYGIPYLDVVVPIGISYYTFKALSYVIDVYRGVVKPESNLLIFSLYVSFFPQVMMGPIDRAKSLIPQFHEKHTFDYERIADGLKLMLWGFFKKLVIADRIAILVNVVYNNPTNYKGLPLILATYSFAIQLFYDFSGYTDIARGVAQVFGYKTMKNFNHPYYSQTVSELWRRWHISLSSWLNDYIFMPILFLKKQWGIFAVIFSTIVTFLISGLWHGAKWTFVIWGALHGLGVSFDALTKKMRKKIRKKMPDLLFKYTSIFVTFHFVCFTFIFFRANTVADAFYIVSNLLDVQRIALNINDLRLDYLDYKILIFSIIMLTIVGYLERRYENIICLLKIKPIVIRWLIYIMLIFSIIILGVYDVEEKAQFIYFQF